MFLHHFIVCFLQAMPQPTQRTALVRLNSFVISLLICSHNLSEAGRQSDETTTGVKGKKATYCLPPSSHRLPPPGGAPSSSEKGPRGETSRANYCCGLHLIVSLLQAMPHPPQRKDQEVRRLERITVAVFISSFASSRRCWCLILLRERTDRERTDKERTDR